MKELSIMIYLVPNHFRKTIVAVRNAGISLVLLAIMWILYVGFSGGFSDLSSAILYSLTILTVVTQGTVLCVDGSCLGCYDEIGDATCQDKSDDFKNR